MKTSSSTPFIYWHFIIITLNIINNCFDVILVAQYLGSIYVVFINVVVFSSLLYDVELKFFEEGYRF
jgi:type IV secretory pathway TrbL component